VTILAASGRDDVSNENPVQPAARLVLFGRDLREQVIHVPGGARRRGPFSLHFMTPVLVLLAVAAGEVSRPMQLAILGGVAVNVWGV